MGLDHKVTIAGPDFHVDLAALDARHPEHYSRRLLIFRCASDAERAGQIRSLKIGVEALLKRCPILGGRVVPPSPEEAANGNEDWRTVVPAFGLEVSIKDLRSYLPSFNKMEESDFAPDNFPFDILVPVAADLNNERLLPACRIQYTANEGGAIIAFAMSHCVADGGGNNELLRIMSEEIRRAQQPQGVDQGPTSSDVVGLDRSVLRKITSERPFNIGEQPAFMWPPEKRQDPPTVERMFRHLFVATKLEVPILFKISAEDLARLKRKATPPDLPFISTHDALCAIIWRSVLHVRYHRTAVPKDSFNLVEAQFFMPSDARHALGLPTTYIGNAVYQLTAELNLKELFSPQGLQHAAGAIRRAITAATPDLISSYMVQIRDKWVPWKFLDTYNTIGVAMGTDWTSNEIYGHDWGADFGPVVRYRYPGDAANCILPKLPDGGAELYISVMHGEVAKLREEFVKCLS